LAEKRPGSLHLAAAALAAAALALGGCGLGAGDTPTGVALLVTRDFGQRVVTNRAVAQVRGSETVMRLLARNAKVTTRYGGSFVQSIDGVSGGSPGGRDIDWFFYVNGVLSDKGAAATKVGDGDRVWWDHHRWDATPDVDAAVGAFPEPFRHGVDGKRRPVRVECVQPRGSACERVVDQLTGAGVPAARGGLGTTELDQTLRILVGPYRDLRRDRRVTVLARGVDESGVFARFGAGGRSLSALDDAGRTTRTLRSGAGLVAAIRPELGLPLWLVTGTDEAGVTAAAGAFDEGTLQRRFALAVDGDGLGVALPDQAR